MKIAVTCENDMVFQHFGHTPSFAIFEIESGRIVHESRLDCGESGHGALAGLLADAGVELLICGGIGGGAIAALENAGIKVVGGASGDVRTAAADLAAGRLSTRPDFHCRHHDGGGHDCGSHSCGR